MARRSLLVLVGIAVLLDLIALNAFAVWKASETDAADEATKEGGRVAAFVVTLAFPLIMVAANVSGRVDAFSQGAIVLAVVLQTILFSGWISDKAGESAQYFWVATAFPAILILVTLLFNYLQKET